MNEKLLAQMMGQLLAEAQVGGSIPNLNTDEQGLIFARDLISMSNDVYMEEMPAPVALTMFAQEPGISEGAKWAGYRMYSAAGMAKIMAAYGTDMPMMSAKGREYFALMYDIGLGYGYTYSDVLAAAMSGTPLDNILALNTREAHERTVSNLLWRGNKEYQIVGFIEHPNIPLVAVTGAWSTNDGDKICDDVSAIIAAVNSTKIYQVNEFHMPSKAWSRIQGLRLSGTLGTVLSFLRTSYPEITFRKNSDLDDDGICIALDNTRRHFAQATPILFRQLPVQRSGLDLSIPCLSKTAGVIVRAPLAAAKSSKVI
ncbi:major capsid family protein [Pseudescherichia sp.]|uniref:major capsid family protein n=1 Tax=Pseudescherichia sp. TaxID=2055881 RepID=UPI0028AC89F5|nr:major capsid family protein [Pseudescherichia sp.]